MFAILFGAAEIQANDADASLTDWSEFPGVLDRRKDAS
jgi:hypothetical protein